MSDTPSLENVSLTIRKGQKIAVMGANGSGKSTFFLCCNGILKPEKGVLFFHGQPVDYSKKGLQRLRSKVGIVFQNPDNQLLSASVYQEISFGVLNLGFSKEEAKERVEQVMEEFSITPFRNRPTHALSGGEKKQVSIADILVMEPEVVLMDEPTAALDPKHTKLVYQVIEELSENGITVIVATHDVDYACQWADEIIVMEKGRVLAQDVPQKIFTSRELLKKANLEIPMVIRVTQYLQEADILEKESTVPRSIEDLEELIKERRR
nr:ABC transporter ATP-binding protein [Aequitasia blattaphilus]